MDRSGNGDGPGDWLLTAAERGNEATGIDRDRPGAPDGVAWSDGNRVLPLIHGATYFRRLLAELRDCRAGDQVYFTAWRGDPTQLLDESDTAVSLELARAVCAGAGVHGFIWRSHFDWLYKQAKDNRDFVKMLQVLGGKVLLDQRVRSFGTHHQKFVVIRRPDRPETDVAFVGGIDFSHSRRDDADHRGDPQPRRHMAALYGQTPAWHDAHLQIHGPAVADVEYCFRERWDDPTALQHLPWLWVYDKVKQRRRGSWKLPEPLPPPPACGRHTVQLLRTYPNKMLPYPFAPAGERSVARGYVKAVSRARQLIYVEDQFLWSPPVARVFADALRRNPELRMIAVVPRAPDGDGTVQVTASDLAQRRAMRRLFAAGGDRVDVYELDSPEGMPVYVHAKVCVVDDTWVTVGSANLNRRSWTHDSELTAAVLDGSGEETTSGGFARELRLALWREHLDRAGGDDADLLDPVRGSAALRAAADRVDAWHAGGRREQRPAGRLRRHPVPEVPLRHRWWASPAVRVLYDPDGRPRSTRARGQW